MPIRSGGCLRTYVCFVLVFYCLTRTNCHEGKLHHLQKRSSDSTLSCHCESEFVNLMCTDEPTDCTPDETRYRNSCYRFFQNDLKSHDDAQLHCMQRHSHLVYIGSFEEQLFLQNVATILRNGSRYYNNDNYWIGLTSTLKFTWQDGRPLQPGLVPEFPKEQGCFYLSGEELKLKVGNCEMTSRFICEKVTSEDCKGSNSCYMISSESSARLSQGDAQLRCSLIHGGHLVTIDLTEELTFIRGLHLGRTNVNTTYWIGLKSEYIWLDGTKANYQTFVRKARSHGQGDMCYKLDPWNGFMWDDHDCTGKRYSYICERELPARKQLHTSDDVCSPPLANLNRLVGNGSICVRNSSDVFGIPILCRCGTEDCVDGCSCVMLDRRQNFTCTCGYCSFSVAPVRNLSVDEWQVTTPPLSCACTDRSGDSRNQTNAYEFQDGAFRSLNNSSCVVNELASSNSGISVGVIIAVLVTVVVVSLIVLLFRQKRSKNSPQSNLTLTVDPKTKTELPHDYETTTSSTNNLTTTQENATPNVVAGGVDDDVYYANPDYEDPTTVTQQMDKPRKPNDPGIPTPPKVAPFNPKGNDSKYEYVNEGGTSGTRRDDVQIEGGYQGLIKPRGWRKNSNDDALTDAYATLEDPSGVESVD